MNILVSQCITPLEVLLSQGTKYDFLKVCYLHFKHLTAAEHQQIEMHLQNVKKQTNKQKLLMLERI